MHSLSFSLSLSLSLCFCVPLLFSSSLSLLLFQGEVGSFIESLSGWGDGLLLPVPLLESMLLVAKQSLSGKQAIINLVWGMDTGSRLHSVQRVYAWKIITSLHIGISMILE